MSSRPAEPCIFVIFGASGDLTRRKLLPAIYNLAESGHLPDVVRDRRRRAAAIDEAAFRAQMREHVLQAEGEPLEPDKWQRIEERLHYVSGEFDDRRSVRAPAHERWRELQTQHDDPAELPVLLRHAARPLRHGRPAARRRRARQRGATAGAA